MISLFVVKGGEGSMPLMIKVDERISVLLAFSSRDIGQYFIEENFSPPYREQYQVVDFSLEEFDFLNSETIRLGKKLLIQLFSEKSKSG